MSVPDTPLTRGEQYLNRAATGSGEIPDTPLTRKEQYLSKIAGQDVELPDVPLTREEMYLAEIAENGGGGGDVTLIDNKDIDANGEYPASYDNADGYKKVTVSVANSYAAADEGKVVSSGALVAQTAHAQVTQNGTVDTTLNNSVEVAVPQPSGTKQISITQNGTTTENVSGYASAEISVNVQSSAPDGLVNGSIVSTLWTGTVSNHNTLNGFSSTGTYKYVYIPLSNPIPITVGDTIKLKMTITSGTTGWCGYGIILANQIFENNNTNGDSEVTFTAEVAGDITMFTIMSRSTSWSNAYGTLTISVNGVTVF